jgi:hypothetical protein
MVWVLIIGNVLGALSLYPICAYMGNIAFLRASLLIAPIAVLAATGAYSVKGAWTDLVLTFLFMFVGVGMRKFKFNPVPLLLAFILGPLGQNSNDLWCLLSQATNRLSTLDAHGYLARVHFLDHLQREEKGREEGRKDQGQSYIQSIFYSSFCRVYILV